LERHQPPDARYAHFIAAIEQTARRAGVEGSIGWLGILNPAEVAYALRQSTLSVFPSLCESFGLPLVEAMAAGCPVAAADRGYARETLGDCGVFFDPCDSSAIASILLHVLRDAGLRREMRRRGRLRAQRYSYPRIASEIADLIERHSQPALAPRRTGRIAEH
jgi:glycosyltransferase involved in cell wall biosynthesis